MLTIVLVRHTARVLAWGLGLGALVMYLLFGGALARSVVMGGLLVGGSGMVQIWLIGRILDPESTLPHKLVAGLFLTFKLLVVCGFLWWMLGQGPDALGLMVGMLIGLGAVVVGVSQGASSPEGLAAMSDAQQKIEEKLEDIDSEKR
ncbi:MAG: hypothetical protein KTR25_05285 [Myxococcales bacterium]|nr:hypothetical protein [Myxococcales bacterium]